jgi:RNA polymerase sigma-70 factor, ECF subfamily
MAGSVADPELEALRAGDEAAFEALVRRHHAHMLSLARAEVGDRGHAEEVVQETWLTFVHSLDRFEGKSSVKTWLFGILINVARARRRRESRLLPLTSWLRRDPTDSRRPSVDSHRFGRDGMWSTPPAPWNELPEERLLSQETLGQVKGAIEALPPKLREVIILRDVAGWDAEETSSVLAISAANQRVRLHRARAAVRQRLEEYLR